MGRKIVALLLIMGVHVRGFTEYFNWQKNIQTWLDSIILYKNKIHPHM